jgi:hypothetical protein
MHRPSPTTASCGARPRRLTLLGSLALLSGLGAGPAGHAAEPPYPSRDQLRELQLITFNCARDNQPDDCDGARLLADPLLDHPRLPGLCKDSLWTISENAVAVPSNSFERRDRLDRAGEDLMRFCPRNPPAPARGGSAPSGPPGGGIRGLFGR